MKKYIYKNIICYQSYGCWDADYNDHGTRIALHRCGCRTKAYAYEIAKANVDYMNRNGKAEKHYEVCFN